MKYLMILTVGVLLVAPVLAEQQTAPPKPGPEHKKLADWEGSWNCEGKTSEGTSSGSMTCEWVGGGFFMKCSGPWKQASGSTVEIHTIMGYNRHEKSYTWYRYWSDGWSDFSKAWIRDNTWTFVFENERVNDKVRRRQMTTAFTSDSFTMKWERSIEGEPWHVTTEGKCTKVKATTN